MTKVNLLMLIVLGFTFNGCVFHWNEPDPIVKIEYIKEKVSQTFFFFLYGFRVF